MTTVRNSINKILMYHNTVSYVRVLDNDLCFFFYFLFINIINKLHIIHFN